MLHHYKWTNINWHKYKCKNDTEVQPFIWNFKYRSNFSALQNVWWRKNKHCNCNKTYKNTAYQSDCFSCLAVCNLQKEVYTHHHVMFKSPCGSKKDCPYKANQSYFLIPEKRKSQTVAGKYIDNCNDNGARNKNSTNIQFKIG